MQRHAKTVRAMATCTNATSTPISTLLSILSKGSSPGASSKNMSLEHWPEAACRSIHVVHLFRQASMPYSFHLTADDTKPSINFNSQVSFNPSDWESLMKLNCTDHHRSFEITKALSRRSKYCPTVDRFIASRLSADERVRIHQRSKNTDAIFDSSLKSVVGRDCQTLRYIDMVDYSAELKEADLCSIFATACKVDLNLLRASSISEDSHSPSQSLELTCREELNLLSNTQLQQLCRNFAIDPPKGRVQLLSVLSDHLKLPSSLKKSALSLSELDALLKRLKKLQNDLFILLNVPPPIDSKKQKLLLQCASLISNRSVAACKKLL